ncbi:MAG TPA: isopentenyl phosphate kinase [Candidatus Binatia bacterium]|jgi:isopentenyl phosphate kinase|nr:isopentenyl phosphate kinase [Candidatus Binatia bacterium]
MSREGPLFLKLGGSLITDKTAVETVRQGVLDRLAAEIAKARRMRPEMQLLIGHGSGSFGHSAAARYQTQVGVDGDEQWMGFCQVSAAAARLNRLVCEALLQAGVPAASMQPSASAVCDNGALVEMATKPVEAALKSGLVPLVYGDVAFDRVKGGTIISTEKVLSFLSTRLKPSWLLLAGDTPGVYDSSGRPVRQITPATVGEIEGALGASAGTDVTGGMAGKVRDMLALVQAEQSLAIRIFSGKDPGRLQAVLLDPGQAAGTLITR